MNGAAARPERLRLLLTLALTVIASSVGCQQQIAALQGWVTQGDKSTISLLEQPEVELASRPVVGAVVNVHQWDRGKDRVVCKTSTDRTGHFSVAVLREPGGLSQWELTVEKPGFTPASTGWRWLPYRTSLPWRVELTPEK
jgi:hypothetical protein